MIYFLFFVFLLGIAGSAIIVTRKIPHVLATPRDVIDDYFHQSSSRMHIRALRLKTWVKKGDYWDHILPPLIKFLRKIHRGLLRLEHLSLSLMAAAREKTAERKTARFHSRESYSWDDVKKSSADEDGGKSVITRGEKR